MSKTIKFKAIDKASKLVCETKISFTCPDCVEDAYIEDLIRFSFVGSMFSGGTEKGFVDSFTLGLKAGVNAYNRKDLKFFQESHESSSRLHISLDKKFDMTLSIT